MTTAREVLDLAERMGVRVSLSPDPGKVRVESKGSEIPAGLIVLVLENKTEVLRALSMVAS